MQQIESSPKFIHKLVKPLVSLGIFFAVLLVLWIVDSTYRVRNIDVTGSVKSRAVYGLESLYGQSMLLHETETFTQHIKRANPTLSSIIVTKSYPNTLKVKLAYSRPVAALQVSNGFFLLDETGLIVEKQSSSPSAAIPPILYYQQFSASDYDLGTNISAQDIKGALFFLKKLQSLGITINSIDIDGFHMLGLYGSDIAYIFSVEKDTKLQAYQLEQVVKKLKLEGTEYTKIDFRFDKPILTL
ncbi:MAG: cell division protein FtsQ/DivIB [Weeksellaceae bacterium]